MIVASIEKLMVLLADADCCHKLTETQYQLTQWQLSKVVYRENYAVCCWLMSVAVTQRRIDVDLTDSCHLWKTYWCGTDWILVWHWLRYHLWTKYWCGTDSYHMQKKDWCGTGWQLSPIEKKIGVALTESYHLWEILVWHCDWLTVITYGKNIGVALTELLPMEKNIDVTLTELLPMEKNIGVTLSYYLWKKILVWHWAITYGKKLLVWHWLSYYLWGKHRYGTDCYHLWREKILVWHWLTIVNYGKKDWCGTDWELSPMGKYWCGTVTDWQLSPMEKYWCGTDWAITCGHFFDVALTELSTVEKNIGVALTELLPMEKKYWCRTDWAITYGENIGMALTVITYGEKKYWCGTDWQLSTMENILVWH